MMGLGQQLKERVVVPTFVRVARWRGDPLARLLGHEVRTDPYPVYADLRRRGALVRSPLGTWMTARHATALAVLRDPRFSSAPEHQSGYRATLYDTGDPRADLAPDLLTLEAPDHTRIRRLVSSAFGPRTIAGLEAVVRDVTAAALDPLGGRAGFDLIDQVAFPVPIAVICHLLGVPDADRARFRDWGHRLAATLEPDGVGAEEMRTRSAELALTAYLRALVAERRAAPDASLLSALAAAEAEGDHLSPAELVATAQLILVAGFETTVNLIGNGTLALLGQPGTWARLGAEPDLLPGAVEELLRWDSPVQLTARTATEDIEVGETTVRRGQSVIVAIGGANRDPDVFDRPDVLDVERADAGRHLSFSFGMHHCLGASLARLEARVVFEELSRRWPDLEAVGPPVGCPRMVLRGWDHIAVRAA